MVQSLPWVSQVADKKSETNINGSFQYLDFFLGIISLKRASFSNGEEGVHFSIGGFIFMCGVPHGGHLVRLGDQLSISVKKVVLSFNLRYTVLGSNKDECSYLSHKNLCSLHCKGQSFQHDLSIINSYFQTDKP